jgi:D-3-phosphoglycerate dehydrogenase
VASQKVKSKLGSSWVAGQKVKSKLGSTWVASQKVKSKFGSTFLTCQEAQGTLYCRKGARYSGFCVTRPLGHAKQPKPSSEIMLIAVLDDYQDAFRALMCVQPLLLQGHTLRVFTDTEKDLDRLAARLAGCQAVVLTQQRSAFPRALIERLPDSVRLLAQTGRSTQHIDVAACTQRGIAVAAAGQSSPHAPAELTWALILASLRHVPYEATRLAQGHWQSTLGTGLHGKTLGVYALGKIGRCVAQVGAAFGMRVLCFGRQASLQSAQALGYQVAHSRQQLFAESDVLTLHLPLVPDTRGSITEADLLQMKPTALLCNTSRAALLAPGALVAALAQGRPGSAAVDVFEEEPVLDGQHPLLKLPNVLCTPHLGYVERGTYERYYTTVVDSLLAFAAGQPQNLINPEVLQAR